MNKYRKPKKKQVSHLNETNLNVYSAILSGGGDCGNSGYAGEEYICVVEKKKNNVLLPAGGVSLQEKMKTFSEKEKRHLFVETMYAYFHKEGMSLCDISEEYILHMYKEIISDEIKNSVPKFNAMIEVIEETGKIFFRNLKLLHREKHGVHEKFFFKGEEYLFFSVIGKHVEPVLMPHDQADGQPIDGRDFFCQDSDLCSSYVKLGFRDLITSYNNETELFYRYGHGGHTIALIKFIEKSSFFLMEENKDLIFIFEDMKRKFLK